mmetsp:Transcript_1422/g.4430  ORF Transcript_1422/g.4430 Transcript_1422/m.4430 type:complete len:469 (-) Transcript_1422:1195-2601(-)
MGALPGMERNRTTVRVHGQGRQPGSGLIGRRRAVGGARCLGCLTGCWPEALGSCQELEFAQRHVPAGQRHARHKLLSVLGRGLAGRGAVRARAPGSWDIPQGSGLALRTVLELLHGDLAVLHVPLLVADPLHEVGLGLDHDNAAPEARKGLGQSLHGLDVKVVGGLVHRDEVGLGPEHGGQGEPDLLTGGEAPDLPVAAHLLINAEGLAVPHDLAARERALVEASGLRRDPLVTGDDDLVEAHGLELGDGLDGVLLGVVQALPVDLVGELRAHLRAAQELVDLVAVLPVLLGQVLAPLRLLLVLGLYEALLQVAVVAVLEARRDVDEGRGVEEGPQRLEVVLLHVGHPEVAVARDLAQLAVGPLGRARLAAQERHERRLPAAVAAADGHAGVQAELHGAVPDKVVLVLGVPEVHALGLQHSPGARLHALHGTGDGEAQLWGPSGRGDLRRRALLAFLALLLGVEGQVA